MLRITRAYTEPFSNAVVFPRDKLVSPLNFFKHKQLPLATAPVFLHESTHHSCFDSPVGLAITLLWLRASRNAILLNNSTSEPFVVGPTTVVDDIIRVRVALTLLGPLLEGLALFAEYDAIPGHSKLTSVPMSVTGLAFCGNVGEKLEEATLQLLWTARNKESIIARKSDLLKMPLGEKAGYLSGYLMVRNWQIELIKKCQLFYDSNFFLQFVRNYFFDDWSLIELLASEPNDYYDWSNSLLAYFQDRMVGLLRNQHIENVAKEFVRRNLAQGPDVFSYEGRYFPLKIRSFPILPHSDNALGKNRFLDLLKSLFEELPEQKVLQDVFYSDLELIRLRTTLTLAHETYDAVVTKGGHLHINPSSLSTFYIPTNLPVGWTGNVSVDIVLTTVPFGIYEFVSNDNLFQEILHSESQYPSYLKTPLIDWEKRCQKIKEGEKNIADALKYKQSAQYDIEALLNEITENRKEIYISHALICTPDEFLERSKHDLNVNGFLSMLDNDSDLLKDAAAISINYFSLNISTNYVPNWKWSCGSYLDSAIEINKRLKLKRGVSAFLIDNKNKIFLSLI